MNCFNNGNVYGKESNGGGIVSVIGDKAGSNQNNTIIIQNCYNIGDIESYAWGSSGLVGHAQFMSLQLNSSYNLSNSIVGNYVGGLIGNCEGYFDTVKHNILNCYNVDTNYFYVDCPANSTVTNTGLINADGTFPNGTPYPDLLTALNAWVNANKGTYPELKNWVMGDNGYPTFAQ